MAGDTSFSSAPRFRQRKINLKQQLRILREHSLPDNVEDVRGDLLGIVDTGVDKSEEDERHLQAVLSASTSIAAAKPVDAFIPTPEATKKWSEYSKFYTAGWTETESYIRSSATVEDARGTEYNMDESDLEHLNSMNAKVKDSKQKCSEDEFEMICFLIETIVAEKQPFLATDPSQLLSYADIEPHIFTKLEERRRSSRNPMALERLLLDANSPDYAPKLTGSLYRTSVASVKAFGLNIYKHWRERKISCKGGSIFPTLRHETGLASDDTDPYVTFRHREVRHSRKTRRTDQQNSGRLRKLHSEMQGAQALMELILRRERVRLQQIQSDFEVFELRCRVKALKRKLKVGPEADDVKLLVSVSKRTRLEQQAAVRKEAQDRERKAKIAQERLDREREKRENRDGSRAGIASATSGGDRTPTITATSGSRIPNLDHVTVEQQAAEREVALIQAISDKLQQRRDADKGWVNVTEDARVPLVNFLRDQIHSSNSSCLSLFAPRKKDEEEETVEREKEELYETINRRFDNFQSPFFASSTRTQRSTGSQILTDLDFSSIELTNIENLNYMQEMEPRLSLPLNSLDMEDPEVVTIDSRADIQRFSEVDLQRHPDKFSIPRDSPRATCRKRNFGGTTYLDRILPRSMNPQAQFHDTLLATASSDLASDADERLADRFKFDAEHEDDARVLAQLCDDPAKLNGIEPATQNLRFSSMLTAKALELIADASLQRQKALHAMRRRQQLQQQQRATAEAQARNAQLQAQNNVRVQHAQRAAQRQQQRRQKAPVSPVISKTTPAPNSTATGTSNGTSNGNTYTPVSSTPNSKPGTPIDPKMGNSPSKQNGNESKVTAPFKTNGQKTNGHKGNHEEKLTPQMPKVQANG